MDGQQTDRRTRWVCHQEADGVLAVPCHEPCLSPFCSVLCFLIWGKSPTCLLRLWRGPGWGTGRRFVKCGCWAVAGGGL